MKRSRLILTSWTVIVGIIHAFETDFAFAVKSHIAVHITVLFAAFVLIVHEFRRIFYISFHYQVIDLQLIGIESLSTSTRKLIYIFQ